MRLCGSLLGYTEQYVEYDPFLTPPDPSNPWITDDTTLWELEARFARKDEIRLDSLIGLCVCVFYFTTCCSAVLIFSCNLCRLVWQQGARPAESEEVGLWHRRGLKRPCGERAVPQVPRVRVQLREFKVHTNTPMHGALLPVNERSSPCPL